MGLEFRRGRDGMLRQWWYGQYKRPNGRRALVNLNVPFDGTPPGSGKVADFGDAAFESSRTRALVALETLQSEAKNRRMTTAAAFRRFKETTGAALAPAPLADLLTARDGDRRKPSNKSAHVDGAKIRGFLKWAEGRGLATVLDVSVAAAKAYMDDIYNPDNPRYTARTVRRIKGVLAIAFDRTLPEGAINPWRHPTLRVYEMDGDQQHHREPLTPEQVEQLLATAESEDQEAYDWIVAGLSTGLRKGDVCRLRWSSVDLAAGALRLQTRKTGAVLHLPIMPRFAEVLARRANSRGRDAEFVFSEAAQYVDSGNEHGVTRRVKRIFTHALAPTVAGREGAGADKDLADCYKAVMKAVGALPMTPAKRERMGLVLRLYAKGGSYRSIMAATGLSKGCLSGLFSEAENASGIRFVRREKPSEALTIAEVTRTPRAVGTRAASKYDFHALRTTFVTLAISAGVSVDKLRALTGHATVEIVMRHYFKPKGTDFADDLLKALPKSLTTASAKKITPKKTKK